MIIYIIVIGGGGKQLRTIILAEHMARIFEPIKYNETIRLMTDDTNINAKQLNWTLQVRTFHSDDVNRYKKAGNNLQDYVLKNFKNYVIAIRGKPGTTWFYGDKKLKERGIKEINEDLFDKHLKFLNSTINLWKNS